jgi:hypothetical protein
VAGIISSVNEHIYTGVLIAARPTSRPVGARCRFEHDPEKWEPFSEKIILNNNLERDDDSKKVIPP